MLKLLYFFNHVDLNGGAQEGQALPDGVSDVAGLLVKPGNRDEKYSTPLANGSRVQITINKKLVDASSATQVGDEIVFFPNTR